MDHGYTSNGMQRLYAFLNYYHSAKYYIIGNTQLYLLYGVYDLFYLLRNVYIDDGMPGSYASQQFDELILQFFCLLL